MKDPLRTVFFGTSDFVLSVVEALFRDKRFELVAVVSQSGKPQGRGLAVGKSPVTLRAEELVLPVVTPEKIRTADFEAWLKNLHPDICVVASYGKIIPQNILDIPRFGFINIHPSLLPRHRGATPVPYTFLFGDEITGVTIMQMSAGMDEGDMLWQTKIRVDPDATSQTLLPELFTLGSKKLGDTIAGFVEGTIRPVPQDSALATYSRLLEKEMGKIDWQTESAVQIVRKIKAFTPWPGVYTFLEEKRFKILQAAVLNKKVEQLPGKIIDNEGIQTVDGILVAQTVQLEGKTPVSFEDFLRGMHGKELHFG